MEWRGKSKESEGVERERGKQRQNGVRTDGARIERRERGE